jgi:DUF4097 and DUF4098 domain-containing protein YvlB
MTNRSVIAPFILIGLGLLFLMKNFVQDFRIWDVIGQYWPWLLIGWGLLRVMEVMQWHRQGKPMPRGGMHGGEWALVIFICVLGSTFFQARKSDFFRSERFDIARWELIGESFDYSIAAVQTSVGKTPRIIIENSRGNTKVNGIESDAIRVTGTKTIKAVGKDEADQQHKATDFEIVRSGDQYIIRTNLDRASNAKQAKADLDITVPRGAIVEARGKYGDFDFENIAGSVDVSSDNAGVRMDKIGGDVRVDLRRSDVVRVANASGNVEIKGRGQEVELENVAGSASINGQYTGELRFRSIAKPFRFESQATNLRFEKIEGEVEMVLGRLTARRVLGPIQITGKSKDIDLTDFTDRVTIEVDRGDVNLRPGRLPLSKMDVRTKSGNVELILPPNAKLDLRAEVKKGSINNDFGLPFRVKEEGRSKSLTGMIAGGPEVSLNVDRGEVRLRKSTSLDSDAPEPAPLAPSAPSAPAAPNKPLEITRQ